MSFLSNSLLAVRVHPFAPRFSARDLFSRLPRFSICPVTQNPEPWNQIVKNLPSPIPASCSLNTEKITQCSRLQCHVGRRSEIHLNATLWSLNAGELILRHVVRVKAHTSRSLRSLPLVGRSWAPSLGTLAHYHRISSAAPGFLRCRLISWPAHCLSQPIQADH